MTNSIHEGVPSADMAPRFAASVLDFAHSQVFQRLFDEGMSLVERTAAYLDGPGRLEAQDMPRDLALAYAGESMRLTTRLMQVASWLLLQKGVREDEISPEQAAEEKYRVGAQEICSGGVIDDADYLPEELIELLIASQSVYERVARLDRALFLGEPMSEPDHRVTVFALRHRLHAAFGPAERRYA